jgi:putative tryptophan/tyrosine transport system substrate-binding protein
MTPAILATLALLSAPAQAREAVAVLVSDELDRYAAPLQAFQDTLDQPAQVFKLRGDKETALKIAADLTADPPPMVFALGAKAAWIAVHHGPNVPIVHAMVFAPERYDIKGAFVTGVKADAPPDLVLAQLGLFAPDVSHLGIIIGAGNTSEHVGSSIQAAKDAGMKVTARRVGSARDVRRAFAHMRNEVDALWVLPDRDVIDPTSFHLLRREAERARMPVLAWSPMLVEAGALICVAPDPVRVGEQAAETAARILQGTTAGTIDLVEPDATRVVLNRDTMETIGLVIDDELMDFVDEVVRRPAAR